MMERTQARELVFDSSLLHCGKCGLISLLISCFSSCPLLAAYRQAAIILLGICLFLQICHLCLFLASFIKECHQIHLICLT